MKVIDLLNKIAKGEEIPLKIEINGYEYRQSNGQFWCDELEAYLMNDCTSVYCFNEEVNIIEEDKKIDKLYHCCMSTENEETKFLIKNLNDLSDKINEIIDEVNKLKENK